MPLCKPLGFVQFGRKVAEKGLRFRDGADNKKCIRMLRCVRKPSPHAAPHRIQTQLSSRCAAPQVKYPLNSTNITKKLAL